MGVFRTGTLKLLFQSNVNILPVTINDSYKCFEEFNNIKKGDIRVTYHPLIYTNNYTESEFAKFNEDLQRIIASSLPNNQN
jgi:hypothetical protein